MVGFLAVLLFLLVGRIPMKQELLDCWKAESYQWEHVDNSMSQYFKLSSPESTGFSLVDRINEKEPKYLVP